MVAKNTRKSISGSGRSGGGGNREEKAHKEGLEGRVMKMLSY